LYLSGKGFLSRDRACLNDLWKKKGVFLSTSPSDAWDFIKLTKAACDICGKKISIPHKWAFYFLISVGVWNFVGAGIFGFLINLPIVSYFEVGTILTPNHGQGG
jgi:nitric oxide reductase subunit B